MKWKLVRAYSTQIYVGVISILLMPLYLSILGVELFSVVGIYLLVVALLQIGDFGLSSALQREFTKLRVDPSNRHDVFVAMRTVEWSILLIGAATLTLTYLSLEGLVEILLPRGQGAVGSLGLFLFLMVVSGVCRLFSGIYRGALIGMERQDAVNWALVAFGTLRYVGVLPVIHLVESKGEGFLIYQCVIALLEWFVLGRMVYVDRRLALRGVLPSAEALSKLMVIAGPMAVLSGVWILLTHIDRGILAGILDAEAYGIYTLAVVAGAGVLSLIPPVAQILLPRLSALLLGGERLAFARLYTLSTQLGAALFLSVGVALWFFSYHAIYAWTGNTETAHSAAGLFGTYALANGIAGLAYFPFMLQYANGDLRLHFIASLLSVMLQIPAIWIAATHFGAIGAAVAILSVRCAMYLLWVSIVHRRFAENLSRLWLVRNVLPAMVAVLSVNALLFVVFSETTGRVAGGVLVIVALCVSFAGAVLSMEESRNAVMGMFGRARSGA